MKLISQLQILPTADEIRLLLDTMSRFNEAATFAARLGFEARAFSQPEIHKLAYAAIRERFGLSAQMTVRSIGKAVACFKRDKKNCPVFNPRGSVIYDERIMSFKGMTHVSLSTLNGRRVFLLAFGKHQKNRFDHIKGQADLIFHNNKFYLHVTVDIEEKQEIEVKDFIGVDLGIANIATDSDGNEHSGAGIESIRRKHNLQRKRLQKRGTKGAKKKLRQISGKEARFRRHQNHVISKAIVELAKDTGRGIAIEDLNGIRDRLPVWAKDARNKLSGWSFGQMFAFLSYKAQLAGIPLVKVDPRNTSRTCSECGHCEKDNRKSQKDFLCVSCGHRANAGVNAARNIRSRAQGASKSPLELVTLRG